MHPRLVHPVTLLLTLLISNGIAYVLNQPFIHRKNDAKPSYSFLPMSRLMEEDEKPHVENVLLVECGMFIFVILYNVFHDFLFIIFLTSNHFFITF